MPRFQVTSPDGRTIEVTAPEGATENDAIDYARDNWDTLAASQPKGPGGFLAATKAGFSNLKGDIARVAGRSGLVDLADADKYAKEQGELAKQQFTPESKGWTETPWQEVKELAGGSAAYMAAPLAAGAAAAFAAPAALAGAAGMTAAGLVSAGQFTGSGLSRQMDTGKKLEETDLGNAVMAAIPSAVLDVVGLGKIPGIRQLIGVVAKDVGVEGAKKIAGQTLKQVVADYTKATGKAMSAEGITEAGQQVLERMQAGLELNDPQARQEYWHSLVSGAVLGGAIAPAGRYVERGQIEGQQAQVAAEERKKAAAAARAATPPDTSRNTPEYAKQAADAYLASEQRIADLKKSVKPIDKNSPTLAADRQANATIHAQLKELAATNKDLAVEYMRVQPFLAAAPAAEAPAVEAPATPTAPGAPVAPATAEAPPVVPTPRDTDLFGEATQEQPAPPVDLQTTIDELGAQTRALTGLLQEHETAADNATTPADIARTARQVQKTQTMHDAAQAELQALMVQQVKAAEAAPANPLVAQYKRTMSEMSKAKEAGDWAKAARLADKAMELNKDGAAEQATIAQATIKKQAADLKKFSKTAPTQPELTDEYITPRGSETTVDFEERTTRPAREAAAAREAARTRPTEIPADTAEQGNLFAGEDIQSANRVPGAEPLASRVVKGANQSPMTGTALSVLKQIQQAKQALNAARGRKDKKGVSGAIELIRDLQEKAKPVPAFGDLSSSLATPQPQSLQRETEANNRRAEVMSQYGMGRQGQVLHAATTALANEVAAIGGRPLNAREKRALVTSVRDVFRANPPTQNNLFRIGERVNEQLTALRSDLVNKQRRSAGRTIEPETTTLTAGTPVLTQIERLRGDRNTPPETSARLEQLEDALPRLDPQDVDRYLTRGAREEDWAPIGDYLAQQERMGADSGTQQDIPETRDPELQGTIFDTQAEFDAYLSGDALDALRRIDKERGVAQTLSRAQARIAPLQAAAAEMKQTLGRLQIMYEATKRATAENVTNADAALAKAEARMAEVQGKLEAELSAFRESLARIDAAWKFESDTANDISRLIDANLTAYAGPEAASYAKLQKTREAVAKALAKDVTKTNWTSLRDLQKQVVSDTQSWLTDNAQRDAALTEYVRRDMRLQTELAAQVGRMVELHNRRADVEAGLRDAQQSQKRRVLFKRDLPAAQSARDLAANAAARARGIGETRLAEKVKEMDQLGPQLQNTLEQIDVELGPVLEAQRRRGFVDPAEQARKAAAGRDEQTRKMQKAREALDALPGTRVTQEAYRAALDTLSGADMRIKELQANIDRFQAEYNAKLQLPEAKKESKTSLNSAIRKLDAYRTLMLAASKLLSTEPEARAAAQESLAALQAKAKAEVESQRARVGEKDTPARREALKRAGTDLRSVTKMVNAVSAASATRTPIASATDRRSEKMRFDAFERAQMAETLESEGTTGRLKPPIRGPLARKATNPGTMRTGDLSTTGERKVGVRNPPTQTGQRRGETPLQAARAANELTEINRIEDALEKIEINTDRVEAKLEEAINAENQADIDKYTSFGERLAEAKAIYEERLAALQPAIAGESTPREMGDGTGTLASVETRQALRDGDVEGTLDGLVAETASAEELAILEALRPHIEGVKIGVRDGLRLDGKSIAGVYHEGSNQIEMHPDRLTREDIAHELTHAATASVLNTPDSQLAPHQVAAKLGLTNMMEQMRNNPTFKGEYALTDVKEFASEVFSNPQLREKMDAIGKPQTLLQRFAAFVARLFGGGKPPSGRAVDMVKGILSPARMQRNEVSTPSVFRNRALDYGDAEGSALAKLAERMIARSVPFLERVKGNFGLNIERLVVDMRAAHRAALKRGADATVNSGRLTEQAAYDIIKADQVMPVVQATLLEGPMESYTDANGLHGWKSTGKNSMRDIFEPMQRLGGDSEAEIAMLTQYLVAQRVANKGLDKAGYGDMQLDPKELKAAMDYVNASPERKSVYEEVRTAYNAYNAGLVNMLASTGAISKTLSKELLKDGDYVALYRVDTLGNASLLMGSHTISLGDVKHQPYLASLKGGDTKILPLNETIPRNTTMLVSMALTNRAAKSAAYAYQDLGAGTIQKGQGAPDRAVLHFRQEPAAGETGPDAGKRWIRLDTEGTVLDGIPAEMIIKSLEGTNLVLPGFLKLAGTASNILRSGITRMPVYAMRQLLRDPMIAAGTTGLGGDPFSAVFKAGNEFLKQTRGQSDTARELVLKGLVQSQVYTGDATHDLPKFAQELSSGTNPNAINKLFSAMDRMAVRADTSTRALIYKAAQERGLSEVQAEIHTMESMNFHKRGASAGVQYMHHLIPFFSSQIQGLSIIAKAARGNMPHNEELQIRRKFFNNAMILFGTGIAYAAFMQDDDYYKNAKPRDRMSNWFVPLPGLDEPVKIPIPFEYGFFFSAAVAAVDGMMGLADGDQQRKAIRDLLINAVPGASSLGVPQLIKPAAEVYFNKSFFSGAPLESTGQQRLVASERFNANTSELAKTFARHVPGLSPIQIEHLVNGYFGRAPLMIAAMTNQVFAENAAVQRPAGGVTDTPFFGQALQRKYGGGAADAVYDIADRAMDVKASMEAIAGQGRRERLVDFRKEHAVEIRQMGLSGAFMQQMGVFTKAEKQIRASDMTPEAKKQRIDSLKEQANEYAKKVLGRLQAIEAAY